MWQNCKITRKTVGASIVLKYVFNPRNCKKQYSKVYPFKRSTHAIANLFITMIANVLEVSQQMPSLLITHLKKDIKPIIWAEQINMTTCGGTANAIYESRA